MHRKHCITTKPKRTALTDFAFALARLGLLNNNKPNSQLLQQHIVDLISGKVELGEVVKKQKSIPSIGAEGLVEYATEVDAVITAIGD